MTGRFDPDQGKPYGHCLVCETVFVIRDEADSHMRDTATEGGGRSHRIRITNPTRADRIAGEVRWRVSTAVEDALRDLYVLVDRGELMEAEIASALIAYPDFADEWDEFVKEPEA